MTITMDRVGDVTIIAPTGRMTIGPPLDTYRETISGLLADAQANIVLNLAGVPYADSAALGEIIASRRKLVVAGGRLVIASPRGKVRDLLSLTRIGDLIDTFDDVDAAVTSFDPGPALE